MSDGSYVPAATSRWQRFSYRPISDYAGLSEAMGACVVYMCLITGVCLLFPGVRGSALLVLAAFVGCIGLSLAVAESQNWRGRTRDKAHNEGRLVYPTDDVYQLVMSSSVRLALEDGDKDVTRVVDNFFIGVRPGWFDTVTASTDMLTRGYSAVDNPLLYSISREVDDDEFSLHVRGVFESRYSELLEQARADRADASDALTKSDSAVRTYASLLGQPAFPA